MSKVLVWIEPFAIRDNPTEFLDHAMFLAQAMLHLEERGITFSLFSSKAVVDRLATDYPACRSALLLPTQAEQALLASFNGIWSARQQQVWFDLVCGRGPASEAYGQMVSRVIAEQNPDAIVMWSDNDTVRAAAELAGCPVLHCELGPTRSPFQPTFYVDPCGTNGAASFRRIEHMPSREVPIASRRILDLADPPAPQKARLAELSRVRSDARWLPVRPFVFVPLQLADDLNTSLHSDFSDPLQFLEAVIPSFLSAGYEVLLKGHPNVEARATNLQAEEVALQFARSLGPSVHVAPRHLDTQDQMACIGLSEFVCTINSSLGFESMLLGHPCILLGDAAFDLSGALKRGVEDLGNLPDTLPDADTQAKTLDAMMRHFLHPKDTGHTADVLYKTIEFARRHPGKGFDDPDALADWTSQCDHAGIAERPPTTGLRSDVKGYLEEVSEQAGPKGGLNVTLTGWILDAGPDLPAGRVEVRSGGEVLAQSDTKTSRPDVARSIDARTISLRFSLEFETDPETWSAAVLVSSGADGREVRFPIRKGRLLSLPSDASSWSAPLATLRNGRKVFGLGGRVGRARQWVSQAFSGS